MQGYMHTYRFGNKPTHKCWYLPPFVIIFVQLTVKKEGKKIKIRNIACF